MQTMLDLLLDLKKKNIHLWVDDDKLCYDAPKDALTPVLRATLRQHKDELIGFLRETAPAPAAAIQPVPRTAPLPLSYAQERLWFLEQLEGRSAAYNMPEAWRLVGALNIVALERSLQELVHRHESLRTTFEEDEGVPYQVIHPDMTIDLPRIDLSAYDLDTQRAEVQRLTIAEATRPFDLNHDPMLRATLLGLSSPTSNTADTEHILLLTLHHIASDGWSMGVLVREMTALYEAFNQGQPSPLPDLALQYADFAAWQRDYLQGVVLEQQWRYWKERLADAPELLQLPTDRPRPAQQSFRGDAVSLELDAHLTQQLRTLSRVQGTTLYMTLLAAFQVLMSRYSGETDIVVGSPIANRNRREIEPLIGFFVNTLALRVDLSGHQSEETESEGTRQSSSFQPPSFLDVLAQVQETLLSAYDHQDIPFERLVEELRLTRSLNHNPLFQVMFALQNAPMGTFKLSGLNVTPAECEVQTTRFDMEMHFWEVDDYLQGYCIYSTDLFDKTTIERMADHFQMLLAGIVKNPAQSIAEFPLLTEAERHQLLVEWNDTATDYPADKCIHQLFEDQVERTPDAIAVVFKDEQLTYRELNERANQLAHYLIAQGVGPDVLVGICVERSLEMVLGLLGILKAGGAYMPLDPNYPSERLRFMLDDAKVKVLLTNDSSLPSWPESEAFIVNLAHVHTMQKTNLNCACDPTNLAYVLYTSGSTGQPKGVAMPHRTLCNLITWQQQESHAPTRTLQFAPMNFDVSLQEVFSTVCVGGALVLISEEMRRDPFALLGYLREYNITRLFLPFIALQQLAEVANGEMPPFLREVITAGEQLQITAAITDWFRDSQCTLSNQYGPTESHVVTAYRLADDVLQWSTLPPIGRPIANTEIYILDAHQQPVPSGIAGELHIGGAGVARGYLNHPQLTQEKFISNPFGDPSGPKGHSGKLYKTGDLCRYLPAPDGGSCLQGANIEFLGRIDTQVKLRGFRVELGEIEALLSQQPNVREAVVIVQGTEHEADGESASPQRHANKRLVAYIVGDVAGDVAGLRDKLGQQLPDYMIPSAFVELQAMPLTPSGKIDRRVLHMPDMSALLPEDTFVPPSTPTEITLARIWSEVLDMEQVGIHNNFFELGGHSLLATQVVSRIRQTFAVELPLRTLFEKATVGTLATEVDDLRSTAQQQVMPAIAPADRASPMPLSHAQERLWFFEQLVEERGVYNMPAPLRLRGPLDTDALERALQEIVRRHESLRTTFVINAGSMGAGVTDTEQPIQIIHPATFTLPVIELGTLSAAEQQAEVQRLTNEDATAPFDLAQGPLFRAKLLRLTADEHILLLNVHHIVFDGWSMGVFLNEFSTLYRAYRYGKASPLPELPMQYADFAAWQRQWLSDTVMAEQIAYWQQQLAGLQSLLPLPTDRPRPPVQSFRGDDCQNRLGPSLVTRIEQLSAKTETTPFMILLAAYDILLWRYSGQTDIAVGTPIANRNRVEIEPLIGFFVNTLVMRTDLSGNPSVREVLRRVQQTTLDAYRYQDAPFEKVVEALCPERSRNHSPLIQVLFQFANTPAAAIDLPGLQLESLDFDYPFARFDLTLAIGPDEAGMACHWSYNTDLFDRTTIEAMMGHFQMLLAGLVNWGLNDVEQPIGELPLLTDAEQEHILVDWNAPAAAYADQAHSFHHLFEEQVERTPDAVAVVFPHVGCGMWNAEWTDGSMIHATLSNDPRRAHSELTYRELNARANQLAHHLQALGIGTEKIVGVCVERSIEWVVGFLGILKAGGAYLPLDATYPPERLAFMLEDATPSVILTQSQYRALFPETIPVVCFDTDDVVLTQQPTENPTSQAEPDNLAYVIYTSGSTGKPKGVLNEHRGLANLAQAQVGIFALKPDSRLLQVVSLNFDVSISDMVTTWCAGATLVLVPQDMPLSPNNLVPLINELDITHFGMVPTLMATMNPDTVPNLQIVMVGGEPCPPELVRCWSSDYRFLNLYGPTEVSICTTIMDYSDYTPVAPSQSPPIGTPVADKQLYILDPNLQPVPVGVSGELHIGGPSLARGYLNRPALTAEKFIANPFGAGKLYKTGDLVRWLPVLKDDSPSIEFLGRLDQQVKIRGFRIEIGEIEATLNEHPALEAAVVIAREDRGEKCLVAYMVARKEVETSALRSYLKQKLPDYMIPAFFVQLNAFPRTANDKVDRNALPRPEVEQRSTALVAPRDDLERELTAIWQQALDGPAVSIHDNFFDIGGHSLLAVRLMAHIQQVLERDLPVSLLFQAPTIAEFASALRQQQADFGWSSLIAIQPRGTKPPLFCMPGVGGNVFGFYALARCLGPDQPVYGLQMRGLDGSTPPHTTIEAMAADYITEIRNIQPHGPYHVAGHSFGGLIAFEMAQQLCQAGDAVAQVAIFDMVAPPFVPDSMESMNEASWLAEFAAYLSAVANIDVALSASSMAGLTPNEQLLSLKSALEAATLLPSGSAVRQVRGMVAVFKANQQLVYRPQATVQVPIHLFQAAQQTAEHAVAWARADRQEPTWGWETYAAGPVEVIPIPGDHFTMLAEPNVQTLAQNLQIVNDTKGNMRQRTGRKECSDPR